MRCRCGSYEFHETGREETTLMCVNIFTDAQGRNHIHDPNKRWKVYKCANCGVLNSHPMVYTRMCPAEGCCWQRML